MYTQSKRSSLALAAALAAMTGFAIVPATAQAQTGGATGTATDRKL